MSFKHTRRSSPYSRITRADRLARSRATAASSGQPISCPRSGCGYFVPPSLVDGTEEYWCHNRGHGRVAMRIDGRLEFITEPNIDHPPRARRRRRPRIPCASDGCSSQRRGTCSRLLCWTHCVRLKEPCGCREHDKERERPVRGRASSSSPRRSRYSRSPQPGVSKAASFRRHASKKASPGRCASESASGRRGSDKSSRRRGSDSRSPRRYDSDSDPPRPSRSPPVPWSVSPPSRPPFKGVPSWLEISVAFTDTGLRTNISMPRTQEDFRFRDFTDDMLDRLHLNEAKYGSITVLGVDGTWRELGNGPLPFFHDRPNTDEGYVYLRARTMGDLSAFPAPYYADMSERLKAFQNFTGDRKNPMTGEDAFFMLFDVEASPAELEQLDICLSVVQNSPPQIREKFEHAGRTPKGTWSEFIRECEQHKDTPAATRALCQSPLVRRQLRSQARSPQPGSSRRRRRTRSPSRARTLSPDLGASPEPSSPGNSVWRRPPSTEVGSSGPASTWDDDDDHDLYA
ncbi:hypothetical protein AURDEDRAFT_177125 [Auricularia subglabra TFB-10046 SS5]|uniref:Uncharacterized protein n=1 Tax=Auricularia subglabra (strain TFB-10046 / SS5) TaxID=717982 RepID=J0LBH4_AURST|nr:hypothetical protein AURDEDRAFT_177125 [Auricularia subglabra TFB-10046 SS5]